MTVRTKISRLYNKGCNIWLCTTKLRKTLKRGHMEIQVAHGTEVSDTVLRSKLLPDEVDMIVEASAEAPGGHLV